jgi:uncharacterized Ntn-hydrolase superfamily protein
MTFSILALDPSTGDLGVAVASKFLAVGAVVPFARASVGAVATQALANTSYGPRGLDLLAGGLDPNAVIERLQAGDLEQDVPSRQVGIVDATGRAATFTGEGCHVWAGGRAAPNYACQGNILAGPAVVDALAETFERAQGDLPHRLLAALAAGQAAGGDRRGQQSAALLVVRERGGYGGWNDRWIDLRVDDHRQPVDELGRLLELWRVYFDATPDPSQRVPLDPELVREIQQRLALEPSGVWDAPTRAALRSWAGTENLEERLGDADAASIDPIVLRMLRQTRA